MLSSTDVLNAISDEKAANLFKTVACSKSNGNRTLLSCKMKMTRKQYYCKMKSLTKAGLIERKNGKYFLTLFGQVVYNYELAIETAVNYYWKLKALDSIVLSLSHDNIKIPIEERVVLVDKLIDNDKIKEIIIPVINDTIATTMVKRSCATLIPFILFFSNIFN